MKHVALVCVAAITLVLGAPAAGAGGRPLRVEAERLANHPEVELAVTVPYEVAAGAVPTDAFAVYEDGQRRRAAVESVSGSDLEVIVVLDTTGSMGGSPIREAKAAAISFLDGLPAGTAVAVLAYDTKAYRVSPFSTDMRRHAKAIRSLQAGGKTALYDAISEALRSFSGTTTAQRAIVLLTDGEDNASKVSLDDVTAQLVLADVPMFGVEYKTAYSDELGLREMVSVTGGRVVRAGDPQGLIRVYGEIAAELSNQYRVTYTSAAAGTTPVTVQLTHDSVTAEGSTTLRLPAAPSPPRAVASPPPAAVVPSREATGVQTLLANRWALVAGAALIFLAMMLLALLLLLPRRKRVNLLTAGAANAPKVREGWSDIASHLTDAAEKRLSRRGLGAKLNAALERAGINLRPAEFAVLTASLALAAFALGTIASTALMGVFAAMFVVFATRAYVSFRSGRRQSKFGDQLNDTLQLLAGSLRAGYGMMQAIDSVAREAQQPTAEEFSRLVVEARLGRDLTAAMQAMGERVASEDFEWVIQAIAIHREVGGDLAEVLDTVAGTIRERNQIRRQIKALSAEGKLSGIILTLLPVAVGLLIGASNPTYMAPLFGSAVGIAALGTGFILMVVGGFWMRHFINLKF